MRATYIGGNRLLTRIDVASHQFVFYVEADDKLITPWLVTTGRYDNASTLFLLNELSEDSHCVDVGANFGYFSCLMARLSPRGRVIGIEADAHIATLARDNVLINSLHEIAEIRNVAANATGEEMRLYRRGMRSGNTSMINLGVVYTDFMVEPAEEEFTVAGARIDDLLTEFGGRIDFLKVDVEGAEPLVFEGARQAIEDNPQLRILMEWSPGQIQAAGFDIPEFLRSLGTMGLRASAFRRDRPEAVSFSEVLSMPYQSGLLFSR